MKPIQLSRENGVLFLILIVGAGIRLFGLDGFSYSADEVSALLRTDYTSLGDALKYGVKVNDMHPAGTQLFLYWWTALFGYNEWVVRIPFVLMGIGAILLTYKIAREWFSVETGLVAAALIAGLEHFIVYAEVARPYSPGLFFSLATVFYWNKIVWPREVRAKHYLWFALSCLGAMYSHYYAFVFVAMVAATGLIWIKPAKRKPYLLTGLGIVLLYLPHLMITLYQFSRGGLAEWLGPPDRYWILNYGYYLFNESWWVIGGLVLLSGVGIYLKIRRPQVSKFHLIGLMWFTVAFVFGYVYSKTRSPILQPPVLIFCVPFALIVLADLVATTKHLWFRLWLPVTALALTAGSTTIERNYFNTTHFGVLEEISLANQEWMNAYPNDVAAIVNVSDLRYMEFFKDKKGLDIPYHWNDMDSTYKWDNLTRYIQSSTTNYLSYGWSTRSNPVLVYERIKLYYPYVVDDRVYNNSRVTLFSKTEGSAPSPVKSLSFDFEDTSPFFKGNTATIHSAPGKGSFIELESDQPYGVEIKIPLNRLAIGPDRYLAFEFDFKCDGAPPVFVYSVERGDQLVTFSDGTEAWYGIELGAFVIEEGTWNRGAHGRIFDEALQPEDVAKIYLWNRDGSHVWLDNLKISTYEVDF